MGGLRELSGEEAQGPCGGTCHRWQYVEPMQWQWHLCRVLIECVNCHGVYWYQLSPKEWQQFLLYLGTRKKRS